MVFELPFRADEVDSTPGVFSVTLLYFWLSFSFFKPVFLFGLFPFNLTADSFKRCEVFRIPYFSNLGFLCGLFSGLLRCLIGFLSN